MGIICVGGDESNHGSYPEIYAVVFSHLLSDARYYDSNSDVKFPKIRKNTYPNKWNLYIGPRKLAFTIVPKELSKKSDALLPIYYTLLGSKRFRREIEDDVDRINILIDGEPAGEIEIGLKKMISRTIGFPQSRMHVYASSKLDVRSLIVNHADKCANVLFRTRTLEELIGDKRFIPLQYP